jgi:predicted RNA-binding Zn-ribbon protein involved in translation (DUF1610 family)
MKSRKEIKEIFFAGIEYNDCGDDTVIFPWDTEYDETIDIIQEFLQEMEKEPDKTGDGCQDWRLTPIDTATIRKNCDVTCPKCGHEYESEVSGYPTDDTGDGWEVDNDPEPCPQCGEKVDSCCDNVYLHGQGYEEDELSWTLDNSFFIGYHSNSGWESKGL